MSRLIYYKNLTKSYLNQNKLYGGAAGAAGGERGGPPHHPLERGSSSGSDTDPGNWDATRRFVDEDTDDDLDQYRRPLQQRGPQQQQIPYFYERSQSSASSGFWGPGRNVTSAVVRPQLSGPDDSLETIMKRTHEVSTLATSLGASWIVSMNADRDYLIDSGFEYSRDGFDDSHTSGNIYEYLQRGASRPNFRRRRPESRTPSVLEPGAGSQPAQEPGAGAGAGAGTGAGAGAGARNRGASASSVPMQEPAVVGPPPPSGPADSLETIVSRARQFAQSESSLHLPDYPYRTYLLASGLEYNYDGYPDYNTNYAIYEYVLQPPFIPQYRRRRPASLFGVQSRTLSISEPTIVQPPQSGSSVARRQSAQEPGAYRGPDRDGAASGGEGARGASAS